ncbi:MAG: hypothetical protein N2645_17725 [Clostridia bacterium]|nr:hypothetical protein [Clostridia bacterium]
MYKAFDELIKVIDYLYSVDRVVETKEMICITPTNAKKVFEKNGVNQKEFKQYMNWYKDIGIVLADTDKKRFTSTQRIKGKLRKVVAINKLGYAALKQIRSW